jgi:hypothetical protein
MVFEDVLLFLDEAEDVVLGRTRLAGDVGVLLVVLLD